MPFYDNRPGNKQRKDFFAEDDSFEMRPNRARRSAERLENAFEKRDNRHPARMNGSMGTPRASKVPAGHENPRFKAAPAPMVAAPRASKPATVGRKPAGSPRFEEDPHRPVHTRFDGPRTERSDRFEEGPRSVRAPRFEGRGPIPVPRTFKPAPRSVPRPIRPAERLVIPAAPVLPVVEGEEEMPRENILVGRNPIREAIRSGRDIERLLVAKGDLTGSAREIIAEAHEKRIVVQTVDRVRLDAISPAHQGMIAFASAFRYSTVDAMLETARERGEDPLLVILDGVTDPHNLGAIIRTAECVGAHGVIVPERRAVGLTPAAVKAAAGAVEYLPVAREANLTRLIERLKEEGLWIASAEMNGEPYTQADLTGPLALVVGGEGSGVSRLVSEHSDRKVALPMCGKISSLNASVAAAVLLYEVRRQRG